MLLSPSRRSSPASSSAKLIRHVGLAESDLRAKPDHANSEQIGSGNSSAALERGTPLVLAQWHDSARASLPRPGHHQQLGAPRPAGPGLRAHRSGPLGSTILAKLGRFARYNRHSYHRRRPASALSFALIPSSGRIRDSLVQQRKELAAQ